MGYIEDSVLIRQTFISCQSNIEDAVNLFNDVGFTIHPVKLVLQTPTEHSISWFCIGQCHYDGHSH